MKIMLHKSADIKPKKYFHSVSHISKVLIIILLILKVEEMDERKRNGRIRPFLLAPENAEGSLVNLFLREKEREKERERERERERETHRLGESSADRMPCNPYGSTCKNYEKMSNKPRLPEKRVIKRVENNCVLITRVKNEYLPHHFSSYLMHLRVASL